MGFLLFILSSVLEIVLGVIFGSINFVWHLIAFKWKDGWRKLDKYSLHMALAKDQYGNVMLKTPMNKILIKGEGKYYFGDEDDTISYVTAMNYFKGTSTKFGAWLGRVLNKVDDGHMEKAIDNKILRDLEGLKRLQDAGLVSKTVRASRLTDNSYKSYVKYVQNKPKD